MLPETALNMSSIWTHFTKSGTEIKCKYCEKVFGIRTATGNLTYHFKRNHENSGSSSSTSNQQSLNSYTVRRLSQAQSNNIDKCIAGFFADDMRPFATADGDGFKRMIAALNPQYKLKSRNTYRDLAYSQYDELFPHVKSAVESATQLSLTADMWSSIAKHSYMTVTAHWMLDDFSKIEDALLCVEEMPEAQSSVNIEIRLSEMAANFSISSNNITCTVTDNGPNIVNSVSLIDDWKQLKCANHTIQLAVKKGVQVTAIQRIVGRAKKLVAHFNKSNKKTNAYRRMQCDDGVQQPLTLVSYTQIRWNTVYLMLNRLIKLKDYIRRVLQDPELTSPNHASLDLSASQWSLCSSTVDVLKNFFDATKILSGRKYCTVSLTYPIVCSLKDKLITNADTDVASIVELKQTMANKLDSSFFTDEWVTSLPAIAALMDPRFKRLSFIPADRHTETKDALKEHMYHLARIELDRNVTATDDVIEMNSSGPEPDVFFSQYAGETQESGGELPVSRPDEDPFQERCRMLDNEFELYMSEPALPLVSSTIETDALSWWRANRARFPLLLNTVKSLLAIPASNVPAESANSTAGFICNKTRSSLLPDHVNVLSFLNRNKHFMP